jgi:hypothetical protein
MIINLNLLIIVVLLCSLFVFHITAVLNVAAKVFRCGDNFCHDRLFFGIICAVRAESLHYIVEKIGNLLIAVNDFCSKN